MNPSAAPTVSVVVVNYNGQEHLQECFESLQRLEYPAGSVELICVDNGSTDGSIELMTERFPRVRVLQAGSNIGFAAGCNLGAKEAGGEFVAFANNDMKVNEGWIKGLLDPIDIPNGVVCSSGKILDWEGRHIDFVRGAVNFHGFGSQVASGVPNENVPDVEGPLLFACGGSMLVARNLFLEVGGFDEDFFAFFEDLDFGWRLWVLGYEVAAAPTAISYHRIHSTSRSLASYRLIRNYERNSLMSLIKNVSERHLGHLLSATVLLGLERVLSESSIDPGAYDLWAEQMVESEELDPIGAARLVGFSDVVKNLPGILEQRSKIQSQRKRADHEIFQRFAKPFQPIGRLDSYLQTQARLLSLLGVDGMFQTAEAAFVLVVAQSSASMSSVWETRAGSLAASLGGSFEVTFTGEGFDHPGVRAAGPGPENARLRRLLESHDVVLMHLGHEIDHDAVPRSSLLVVDLSGVDPGPSLGKLIQRADVFLVDKAEDVPAWTEALRTPSSEPQIVVESGDGSALNELCRYPDRLWARRNDARVSRYRYEVQILLDNFERRGAEALQKLALEVEEMKAHRSLLEQEIQRLNAHLAMRTYVSLRKLIPFKRDPE